MNFWINSTLLAAGIAATGGAFADDFHYDQTHDTNQYTNSDPRYSNWNYQNEVVARVVEVNPIITSNPTALRQVCRTGQGGAGHAGGGGGGGRQSYHNDGWGDGYYYDGRNRYDSRSNTPAILGAVIGGLLGNQVGDGRGQTAATIAGAAVGAGVARNRQGRRGTGHDYTNRYYGNQRYYGNGHYDGRSYSGRSYNGDWTPHAVQRCTTTQVRGQSSVAAYDVTYEYNNRLYQTRTNYRPGREIRVRLGQG